MIVSALSPASVRAALVTSLGVLEGNTHSAATDVNDAGVVIGASFSQTDGPVVTFANRGFRYTASGGMQPLTPVGTNSVATAVNNAGVVVGWTGGDLYNGGFGSYWTAAGVAQNFPIGSQAHGINDAGVIVGNLAQAGVPQHAFRYDGTGPQQDLGVIAGTRSCAYDINEAGVIVGWSNINTTALKRAARYVNGAWSAIPGLSNFSDSEARAINESGDIVGIAGASGAFRFSSATGTTTALTSPFGSSRQAWDINDAGYVVGSVDGRAALWRPDGSFVDLETWLDVTSPAEGLSVTLRQANAINNHGFIVGNAGSGGGQGAFLLDARALVPEPAAMSLLLPAAAALLRRRRPRPRPRNR
jgi:probable HAF family extracellular repeat protein